MHIRFDAAIETSLSGEEEVFDELAATMLRIAQTIGDRSRHAFRAVHAKSHGLLKAELAVLSNLPEELRQGLFHEPASYPAMVRFSTNPGDILPDSISTPRGMAVKVLGVPGSEMLAGHQGQVTQDFLCVDAKAFPTPNAKAFLEQLQTLEKHVNDAEALKQFVSTGARLAESALETVGQESAALKGFGHPFTNLLGETYGSTAALRYGDYVAKICFTPASENLKALKDKHLDLSGNHSGLRDAVVEFFKTDTAVWDLQVQLCTDLEAMPVEDPSVQWPEDQSPYVTVARLTAGPQDAYSAERRVYGDEVLSFNPWHGMAAHQPLGNIMRARKKAYEASTHFRHTANGHGRTEPRSIGELPD